MGLIVGVLGVAVIAFIVLIYTSFSWGLVFLKFYHWFVLPVFTTLPVVNYWQSVGLMMFVSLFCRYVGEGVRDEYKDGNQILGIGIVLPWFTLFGGWVIHCLFV